MVRWGILGAGSVSQRRVLPAMRQSASCDAAALMVRDRARAERLAKEFGVARAVDSVDALVSDDGVDAVYVSSPVHLHAEHVRLALEAGKHVLCEKPMGMDGAQCEGMVDAAERAGRLLQVCFVLRGWPIYAAIRGRLAEGRLGRVVELRAHLAKWTPRDTGEWRLDPERSGGGTLVDVASHYIDLFRYLHGEITRVGYMPGASVFGWPVEETAHLLLEFGSGAHGAITASATIPYAGSLLEIYGTEGTLVVGGGKVRVVDAQGEHEEDAVFPDYYTGLLENFSDCVERGAAPIVPGREGLQNVRITEAAYRSHAEAKFIDVAT